MAKKGKVRWGWWIVIILVIVAVAGGIVSELTKKAPIHAAQVAQGSIQAYVEERARTTLPHIYHVTMPMEGRVLPAEVKEGEMVKAGQVVMNIEDTEWRERVEETRDILIAMDNWVKAAESQVKANKILQEFAKWEYGINKKLRKSSAVSEKQERESRRLYLNSNVKIEESQAMYRAAEAFQSIMNLLPTYVNRNLERTRVISPVEGTVLKRHVWNEKVMTPGEPLLDIGDMNELEITADILTEEAVRMQPGDRVDIFGESIGDKHVQGVIRLVEPEAFKKISSLGVEEQRVSVKISFAEGTLEELKKSGRTLGLNYRIRVRVITDEKKQALIVPRTALFRGIDGSWKLYRVEQDRASLTSIEVGLMNDHQAEIVSGVQAGDTVIVAPESSINDGVRVAPME